MLITSEELERIPEVMIRMACDSWRKRRCAHRQHAREGIAVIQMPLSLFW